MATAMITASEITLLNSVSPFRLQREPDLHAFSRVPDVAGHKLRQLCGRHLMVWSSLGRRT
jgi:hypothetical protein